MGYLRRGKGGEGKWDTYSVRANRILEEREVDERGEVWELESTGVFLKPKFKTKHKRRYLPQLREFCFTTA